jgi:hypothetical protein
MTTASYELADPVVMGPGSRPLRGLGREDEAELIAQARQKEPLRSGGKISTNPHRFRRNHGK